MSTDLSEAAVNAGAILAVGDNCWRSETAERLAFLVDADAYFDALVTAMERAERSIHIVGWDVHSRTALRPARDGQPRLELADLLRRLTLAKRKLRVHILSWDFSPILAMEREFLPLVQFQWKTPRRVEFRLASDHPVGAAHHQKIVVVDDAVAFVGGLDLTIARWDGSAHAANDRHRVLPDGEPYGPFHDVQVALSGPIAGALGDLVRRRWQWATQRKLPWRRVDSEPWPPELNADLTDVSVGLARTEPSYASRQPVREVERLHLDAIAAARRWIYIENQYITSPRIGQALAARLAEAGGPEIVIITPKQQSGRLEQATMGVLRAQLVERLRAADSERRLRVLAPTADGIAINVHSKLLIVDETLALVGSANLSTRSMRLDTECGVAIEARAGDRCVARAVAGLRARLMGEHLGLEPDAISAAMARHGSLLRVLDEAPEGRRRLEPLDVAPASQAVDLSLDPSLVDPECGIDEALVRYAVSDAGLERGRRQLPRFALGVVVILALAALWLWGPLGSWLHPDHLTNVARSIRDPVFAPLAATAIFAVLATLLTPVTALIVVMVLLFGSWIGGLCALIGSTLSACMSYALGRVLWGDVLVRLVGRYAKGLMGMLSRRGLWAIVGVRIVPVAPFAVVNLVAGGMRIRVRDFVVGTLVGMAPGILALSFTSDLIVRMVRNPRLDTILLTFAAVILALALFRWFRRLLDRSHHGDGEVRS